MTTFFIVRHGVTHHTGRKLSGRVPDVHLSEEGVTQSKIVAESLADLPLKAVYSSPIERTLETAAAIAERHDLEVKSRPGLSEVEFGRWSDRSFKSLRRTKLWSTAQRWPSGVRFPEGESFIEVRDRAVEELEQLRLQHPREAVCCVSHADVIKLVVAHFLGLHMDNFQRLAIDPASITVVGVSAEGPRVLSVNAPPSTRFSKPPRAAKSRAQR